MRDHTTNQSPLPADTLVRVDLGDGEMIVDRAGSLYWGPGLGPEGEGRIVRYEPIPPADRQPERRATQHRPRALQRITSTRVETHPLVV